MSERMRECRKCRANISLEANFVCFPFWQQLLMRNSLSSGESFSRCLPTGNLKQTDGQTAEQEMAKKLIKFTQEMAEKKEERRKVAKRNGKSAPNLAKSDEQTRIKLPLILFGVDFRST